jgi:hypothetical protein
VKKSLLLKSALALAMAAPLMASAESDITVGAGSASADLTLRVVIPRVLYLAVGTGNATLADNATVDTVEFNYSTNPQDVGTGAAAGAVTGNVVPVRVFGNNGQIQIAASNGTLTEPVSGDTIPLSSISATSSDAANLPSPAAGGSVNVAVSTGRVTNRTANWTYAYANTANAAAGTYEGTITYTATMP